MRWVRPWVAWGWLAGAGAATGSSRLVACFVYCEGTLAAEWHLRSKGISRMAAWATQRGPISMLVEA